MKFSSVVSLLAVPLLAIADSVPWERLDKDNAVLVILDLQVGLYQIARDWDPTLYRDNLLAHAAIGQLFPSLPVVMTTSAQTGPNGPLPKEVLDMYPDAPLIQRQGEVDAWDNEEFRNAIKATNKTQVIIGGITTDVCTFLEKEPAPSPSPPPFQSSK
ncbi:Isochorismatase-like protein [Macrophomina phaseolina MS6]|uniref:Isochorismatase-like protein n=1 Tax=Macrophomina phaseolina (strain MS6) TaxID=1126212 RepID=K2R6K7_MACPH|nr:Isochorismatase-like protein [Macrophomina phaseolina MS6]